MVKIQVFKKEFHTHIYLDYARAEFLSIKKKKKKKKEGQLTVEIKETLRRIYYNYKVYQYNYPKQNEAEEEEEKRVGVRRFIQYAPPA